MMPNLHPPAAVSYLVGGEGTVLFALSGRGHHTTPHKVNAAGQRHRDVQSFMHYGTLTGSITPINKQIKCISQDFESYLVLLVASSVDNDWCSVIGSPSPANVARRILRFAHGRPP